MTQTPIGTSFLLLSLVLSAPAFAGDGSVRILSPAEGAILDDRAQNAVSYEIQTGTGGDHAHLYVDGEQVAILHGPRDTYPLEPLGTGAHRLCIKVVNKNHTPIGVEQCVTVTSKR